MADVVMLVGSLNRAMPNFETANGVGLSVLAFDTENGSTCLLWEERGIDNPTFLCADPETLCVYATSEVPGWHEGTLTAYRYDPEARRLAYINKQPSLGSVSGYCSLDREARIVLVSNYGGLPQGDGPDRAVAVLPLRPDGGLATPVASVTHRGSGIDPARQERPHPHCVLPSPDGRFAVVADLGLDMLASYRLGPGGALSPSPEAVTRLRPGSGPRHLAFHPNGYLAVVSCELDSTIVSLRFDPASGMFTVIETVSTLPDRHGLSHCSDVQIHPNGRRVYAANRGHDSIVDMAFDPSHGGLTTMGHRWCGGRTPRHLALDPTGRHLVVANQDSDEVSMFALDEAGALSERAGGMPMGTPMCVKFLTVGEPRRSSSTRSSST